MDVCTNTITDNWVSRYLIYVQTRQQINLQGLTRLFMIINHLHTGCIHERSRNALPSVGTRGGTRKVALSTVLPPHQTGSATLSYQHSVNANVKLLAFRMRVVCSRDAILRMI